MIYLKKGQTLVDNPGMVVYDPTGYYNDGDSIVCAPVFAPEEPACRYEAQYIAYGGIIYSVSNPEELMEQILKIDPKSLFGKDSSQVALDKMVQDIVPQKSEDVTATSTPSFDFENQNNSNDVASTTATNISTTTPSTQTSTSTPEIPTPTPTPTPTSTPTPSPTPDIDVASSTIPVDVSTTTSPLQVPVDVSTSTPVVTESPSPTPSPTPTPSPEPSATPSPLETPAEPIATSTEVVAFAKNLVKRKISRKLGL